MAGQSRTAAMLQWVRASTGPDGLIDELGEERAQHT
jgi:hypothetical protein